MSSPWKKPLVLLILAGPAVALAAPADPTCWLVLRDGAAIAARCPFEVRGSSLRFRSIGGVLTALPLELVDLDATATARRRPSPRAARTVTVVGPARPSLAAQVGAAGEARKRAGYSGAFIDLSRMVTPPPVARPAAVAPAGSEEPALLVVGAPPATHPPALDKPDPLLRLRLKRSGKPR